jgi:hypothetical protein
LPSACEKIKRKKDKRIVHGRRRNPA